MHTHNPTKAEQLPAAVIIALGIFISNPYLDMFINFPNLYAPMIQLVPFELFWGLFFTVSGILALYLSYSNRAQMATFIMATVFTMLATLFFLGEVRSSAWAVYGTIGGFCFNHWRKLRWILKSAKA